MPKTPAQLAAQQRYRESEKGRAIQHAAQQRYRESELGKAAIARASEARRARKAAAQMARYATVAEDRAFEHPRTGDVYPFVRCGSAGELGTVGSCSTALHG
jgi:hypothetical protein